MIILFYNYYFYFMMNYDNDDDGDNSKDANYNTVSWRGFWKKPKRVLLYYLQKHNLKAFRSDL